MKILVADDKKINRSILKSMLLDMGYEVIEAETGEQALAILSDREGPLIAFLDGEMPDYDGPDLCRMIRSQERESLDYKFLVLATGHDRRSDKAAGFAAGADDYIVKPFDRQELQMRIRVGERLVRLQEKLRFLATRDELTRLWNRRTIMQGLEAKLRETSGLVAAAILDLDHFKRINDTYGHLAGDEVLRETSRRLMSVLDSKGMAGRMGGEEFIVFFAVQSISEAEAFCEIVREKIGRAPVVYRSSDQLDLVKEIPVTASLGLVVAFVPSDLESVLRLADQALYEAKETGRNRSVRCEFLPVTDQEPS
ncbi:MAG: diguanylate cyclase [Sporomusaceae bacterium]|nr:diguanylate cyclase [Sporomusaceae bacterium]